MAQDTREFARKRSLLANSVLGSSFPIDEGKGGILKRSAWYRAYCAAMLQLNAGKLLEEVEAARKAIQDRVAELATGAPEIAGEKRELQQALNYLSLLLRCSNMEGGRLLWH